MKQAVEHHKLTVENERLVGDLRRANLFLEAVMDELDTGAIAVDAAGVIQAVNRPVREYFGARARPARAPLRRAARATRARRGRRGRAVGGGARASVTYSDVDVGSHRFRVTQPPARRRRASRSAAWCCSARSRTSRCAAASTSCVGEWWPATGALRERLEQGRGAAAPSSAKRCGGSAIAIARA